MAKEINDLWESVKGAVKDLATIDVTTLEGDVELKLTSGQAGLTDIMKAVKAQVNSEVSKLTLVAHTHIDFDLDSVMIAKPGASANMVDAHNKAVKTAIDARKGVLDFVKELVP